MSDIDRMRFDTDELYVKSPEEMIEYFKAFPDAIENTVKIAEKCNVEFEFGHTIYLIMMYQRNFLHIMIILKIM